MNEEEVIAADGFWILLMTRSTSLMNASSLMIPLMVMELAVLLNPKLVIGVVKPVIGGVEVMVSWSQTSLWVRVYSGGK
jgi:hypothetical protein